MQVKVCFYDDVVNYYHKGHLEQGYVWGSSTGKKHTYSLWLSRSLMWLQEDRECKSTNFHSLQEPWITWLLQVGTKLYVSEGQELYVSVSNIHTGPSNICLVHEKILPASHGLKFTDILKGGPGL